MDNNFYNNFDVKPSNNGFYSRFLIPFVSGGLGAILVVGVFISKYNVESTITNLESTNSAITTSSSNSLTQVSLNNYSDTAIFAANKALPSIVGIEVEYTVNSFFTGSRFKYSYWFAV